MKPLLTLLFTGIFCCTFSQNFPAEMHLSNDGRMLLTGGHTTTGLYDESMIRTIELYFPQTNYWNLLTQNYQSQTNILATMIVDGEFYDSVGVRFKGNTSYRRLPPNSDKKSFSITVDFVRPDQNLMGYETLNLNNCYQDPSFMREMLYLHLIRNHIPAAKASYVHLMINGQDWGLYPSIQQTNAEFIREWFLSNDGTRWRADSETGGGGGGPGGPGWGDGTAALNYLGADTSLYQQYYTLKSSNKPHPWDDLVNTCDVLENTPLNQLDSAINEVMDLDRTLWFLASEIMFTDDDGYVYKGKMDYSLYWEAETGRMVPLEYDGNSCMDPAKINWTPFHNAQNANYPLLNRLLAVPAIRQRYLAHMRTMVNELLDVSNTHQIINDYAAFIDSMVQSDPKKLESYGNFLTEVQTLKTFITNRRNALLANAEINQTPPVISEAGHAVDGQAWIAPKDSETAWVSANVTANAGVSNVWLHYTNKLVGTFTKVLMKDDGQGGDEVAGDGKYGAGIPAFDAGDWIRYYVEAEAADAAGTRSYMPEGAEHDVFTYQVTLESIVGSPVVINELLASNDSSVADEAGEYDDWIELHNITGDPVDLSGWFLTDSDNFDKWEIPAGTIIGPYDYMIIWADEDGSQGDLHANFKLSASQGEALRLLNPNGFLADEVIFGPQTADIALARVPNGTGNFVQQGPTFDGHNEYATSVEPFNGADNLRFFPNPADRSLFMSYEGNQRVMPIQIINAVGQGIWNGEISGQLQIDISSWPAGIYFIRSEEGLGKLLVR